VGEVEILLHLRDFQARGESPALGLFHGAASSTAFFTHKYCYRAYFEAAESNTELTVDVVIITPTKTLHNVAVPFAGGLFVAFPQVVAELAKHSANAVSELRTKFTGREFTELAVEFSEAMRVRKLTWKDAEKVLLVDKLAANSKG